VRIEVVVTVPKTVFDDKAMVAELTRVQNSKTAPEVKRLFKNTTGGWQHEVDFQSRQRTTSSSIGVSVFPTGTNAKLYALVNNGAAPHNIPKAGTTFMRFQPGYRAGTTPRMIRSRSKARFGDFVVAYKVRHPGFEGREFDSAIGSFYKPEFTRDMQKVIDNQAKKAASPQNSETLK
jgi:hypothetical protein